MHPLTQVYHVLFLIVMYHVFYRQRVCRKLILENWMDNKIEEHEKLINIICQNTPITRVLGDFNTANLIYAFVFLSQIMCLSWFPFKLTTKKYVYLVTFHYT